VRRLDAWYLYSASTVVDYNTLLGVPFLGCFSPGMYRN